jgi:hypothetical protein
MTNEEVIKMYEEMLEWFGELPNPDHDPIQFAHCVKLFKYYKERKENDLHN